MQASLPVFPRPQKFPPYYTTSPGPPQSPRRAVRTKFQQISSSILQFPAKPAILYRKAREQLLNTQLFPFLRPLCAASALRQDPQRRQLTGGCHERKDRLLQRHLRCQIPGHAQAADFGHPAHVCHVWRNGAGPAADGPERQHHAAVAQVWARCCSTFCARARCPRSWVPALPTWAASPSSPTAVPTPRICPTPALRSPCPAWSTCCSAR